MQHRRIGELDVAAIGLGGMPMSIEGRPDRERSIRTIHAALDAGVTLIDTADTYHRDADEIGHNESLIALALETSSGDSDDVLVATKGGHLRPGDGSWTLDGRPEHLREAAQAKSPSSSRSPAPRGPRPSATPCSPPTSSSRPRSWTASADRTRTPARGRLTPWSR